MSQLQSFLDNSENKALDEIHRKKIIKAVTSYDQTVIGMKSEQFKDWAHSREVAGKIKQATLDRLPDYLEEFESKIQARGAQVLWAEDAQAARSFIDEIIARHKVKQVVKSKSMTTEEIDLNEHLEEQDIEVFESDLGELIVQLAGEKPYHIVTPAMHKSKEEIAELFNEKLNSDPDSTAEELTMTARAFLRNAYVTSQIGITGANFLIADEGAVVMIENEGNGRLSMACPPVHVVVAGIEKMLPRLRDLPLFLPLLSTSGTGQEVTCYNSIIKGPKGEEEVDGPEHMYVILLDNGRSELFQDEEFQQALRCIRCGACLNACPVYRTIGGHSYDTTYQGPIGSVITPHLRDLASFGHLAQASSLCGACTDVCPVKIDLHHLLLENRWRSKKAGLSGIKWELILKIWAWVFKSRSRLNGMSKFIQLTQGLVRMLMPKSLREKVPRRAKKSFGELWKERQQ